MAVRLYRCVHCKHTQAKRKRWQDGVLRVAPGGRLTLLALDAGAPDCDAALLAGAARLRVLAQLQLPAAHAHALEESYEFENALVEVGDLIDLISAGPGGGERGDAVAGAARAESRRGGGGGDSGNSSNSGGGAAPSAGCAASARAPSRFVTPLTWSSSEPAAPPPPRHHARAPPSTPAPPAAAPARASPPVPLSTDDLMSIFGFDDEERPQPAPAHELGQEKRPQKAPAQGQQEQQHLGGHVQEGEPLDLTLTHDVEPPGARKLPASGVLPHVSAGLAPARTFLRPAASAAACKENLAPAGLLEALSRVQVHDAAVEPTRAVQVPLYAPGQSLTAYLEVYKTQWSRAIAGEVQLLLNQVNSPRWSEGTLFRKVPYAPRQHVGGGGKRRRWQRKGEEGEEEDDEEEDFEGGAQEQEQERFYLTCAALGSSDVRSKCRLGDLWFVARSKAVTWVFKSLWHGAKAVERGGVVEVAPVQSVGFDSASISSAFKSPTRVTALHSLSVATELGMLEALSALSPQSLPLLPWLLAGARAASAGVPPARPLLGAPDPRVQAVMEGVAESLRLNADQRAVLGRVRGWVDGSGEPGSAVVLVHGAYGSGKTTLCAACCLFLDLVAQQCGLRDVRVIVAAATNVAVDNVLKALLVRGFGSLARVGSLANMDRALLPYALLHSAKGFPHAVDEAKGQLAALPGHEAQQELSRLSQQPVVALQRRQAAAERESRVIGVTCCSAASRDFVAPLFAGRRTLALLDEASQSVEPLSLLPLAKAGAAFALCVGDPMQLPPVTAARPARASSAADKATAVVTSAEPGAVAAAVVATAATTMMPAPAPAPAPTPSAHFGTPLFERLERLGLRPVLLGVQYRCHPDISALASRLFYGGRVKSGVTTQERPPLLQNLAPITWIPVQGCQRQLGQGGESSFVNEQECAVALHVVRALIAAGVPPHDMCVLTIHTRQARALADALVAGGIREVAAATVDAFQGAERAVVVISTCRTGHGQLSGAFASDPNRVNVMLTRARNHLIICGESMALRSSLLWAKIVQASTVASLDAVVAMPRARCNSEGSTSEAEAEQPLPGPGAAS